MELALAEIVVSPLAMPLSDFIIKLEVVANTLIIKTTVPLSSLQDLQNDVLLAAKGADGAIQSVEFQYVAPVASNNQAGLDGVKNTIVVASGKGGVGKSTTTVNLALALQALGAKVGILDADIYGPSLGLMLGVDEDARPDQKDGQYFIPLMAHGLQTISMAYLTTEKTPMAWRGPMAAGALQQMLKQTLWHDLDFLVIDMPPGTGDIQLTLSQQLPVTGAVVVTTPQNVAVLDAQKGIEMFAKTSVPVLGVVENMSYHLCSACGNKDAIFGEGGGNKLSSDYSVPLLGALPLLSSIRELTDSGRPTVVATPDSHEAQAYRNIALKVSQSVAAINSQSSGPTIEISDE